MKIVFLDAYTLSSSNDLDLSALYALGDVRIYDRTPVDKIIERAKEATIVLSNKVPFNELTISELPNLKYIGVTATGYNVIDIEATKKRGIIVANARGYSSDSVAQHTFALILALTNRLNEHLPNAAEEWKNASDWCYYKKPLIELSGKTLGIVGLGNIGKKVADIAQAFGMKVLATKRNLSVSEGQNIELVPLEELLKESDFVSLHCPQTIDNQEFINKNTISLMKPSTYLINTSRGGLINENDLAKALNNGKIAGVALDVLSQEPPTNNNPLLTAKNCLITPHQAWATLEARQRLLEIVVENIKAFVAGSPQNMVS